jgi:hypothetical protein
MQRLENYVYVQVGWFGKVSVTVHVKNHAEEFLSPGVRVPY